MATLHSGRLGRNVRVYERAVAVKNNTIMVPELLKHPGTVRFRTRLGLWCLRRGRRGGWRRVPHDSCWQWATPSGQSGQPHPVDTPPPPAPVTSISPQAKRSIDAFQGGRDLGHLVSYLMNTLVVIFRARAPHPTASWPSSWGGAIFENGWHRLLRQAEWWRFSSLWPPAAAARRQVLCPPPIMSFGADLGPSAPAW